MRGVKMFRIIVGIEYASNAGGLSNTLVCWRDFLGSWGLRLSGLFLEAGGPASCGYPTDAGRPNKECETASLGIVCYFGSLLFFLTIHSHLDPHAINVYEKIFAQDSFFQMVCALTPAFHVKGYTWRRIPCYKRPVP